MILEKGWKISISNNRFISFSSFFLSMKIFTVLVFVIILASLTQAATIQEADFDVNPESFTLQEKDVIRFQMFNGEHEIMLREFNPESRSVKFTAFIENASTPVYIPIFIGQTHALLDINLDKQDDLKIEALIVDENALVVFLTDLNNQVTGSAVLQEEQDTQQPREASKGWIITIAIVVAGVLLFLAFRKSTPPSKQQENNPQDNNQN